MNYILLWALPGIAIWSYAWANRKELYEELAEESKEVLDAYPTLAWAFLLITFIFIWPVGLFYVFNNLK